MGIAAHTIEEVGTPRPANLPFTHSRPGSRGVILWRPRALGCFLAVHTLFCPPRPHQAVAAAAKIGDEEVVIKSQILAGGRGLGTFTNGFQGGVHVIKSSQACLPPCPPLP
eukprot:726794-Prymnesium_polylepis.1